jgi:hypothetical protein
VPFNDLKVAINPTTMWEFEFIDCLVVYWSFGWLAGELIVLCDDWFAGCSVGGFINFLLGR